MENRFDTLAKSLANSVSRREALRRLGWGVLGGLLTAWRGGPAWAAGNSVCAQWCHAHFTGTAADQCTSAAAHGSGACYTCGPAAPASHPDLCGSSSPICCQASTPHCCSGTCADLSSDKNNCGTCGNLCSVGDCVGGSCCTAAGIACTSSSDCCSGQGLTCDPTNPNATNRCCKQPGPSSTCTDNVQCCGFDVLCFNGACCRERSGECSNDDQCCGSLTCQSGFCAG